LVMAGFGLGTIPALTALAGGAASVAALLRRPAWRYLAAALLAGLALLTALGIWGGHAP